ncbi:MAG: DUF3780 domain-containing protein [Dehalococcoidia bacterium]
MSRAGLLGFGFDPAESPYHFAALIPRDVAGAIIIEERLAWEEGKTVVDEPAETAREAHAKAILDPYRWSRIAEVARAQFNRRLKDDGKRASAWKSGETLLAPYLGKELTLLAWAVEDADPTLIPNMIANWLGLAPEERWWLYTTINATSGHPEHGRDRGWRQAIKIAFSDNPASAPSAGLTLPDSQSNRREPRRRRVPPRSNSQLALPVEGRQLIMDEEMP